MNENYPYCVYLTIYRGNKLPMFYIGSTSISKINDGYRGSVSSIEYRKIWEAELRNNPHLFKTAVICTYSTRDEAFKKEYKLQKKLFVVTNPLYINKSYANNNIDENSSDRMLKNNPMKNKHTATKVGKLVSLLWESNYEYMYSKTCSKERNEKVRQSKLGNKNQNFGKHGMFDHLNKTFYKCEHCDMETTIGNIKRWHNDNCELKPT